jgi:hypothetical protein
VHGSPSGPSPKGEVPNRLGLLLGHCEQLVVQAEVMLGHEIVQMGFERLTALLLGSERFCTGAADVIPARQAVIGVRTDLYLATRATAVASSIVELLMVFSDMAAIWPS